MDDQHLANKKFDEMINKLNNFLDQPVYDYYYYVSPSDNYNNIALFTYTEPRPPRIEYAMYEYRTGFVVNINKTTLRINIIFEGSIEYGFNTDFSIEFIGTDDIKLYEQYQGQFNLNSDLCIGGIEYFLDELSKITSILTKNIKSAKIS